MLTLQVVDGRFKVCRLEAGRPVPPALFHLPLVSITRIGAELSIIVPESFPLGAEHVESGWAMLGVVGPLDFALTGILARLAAVLAAAQIPIFALSTFDTDYLLVKYAALQSAIAALRAAGYSVLTDEVR